MFKWLIKNSRWIFNKKGQFRFDPAGFSQELQRQTGGIRQILMGELQRRQQLQQQQQQIEAVRGLVGGAGGGFISGFGPSGLSMRFPTPEQQREVQYRTDIQRAIGGVLPWEQLGKFYPLKKKEIEELKPHFTPLEKEPRFKPTRGLPAFISPFRARITPLTQRVINNIKTEADWTEFLKDAKDYEAAGVDIKAIMEYFGRSQ